MALFLVPEGVYASETLHTGRFDAIFEENGNWSLTDSLERITWRGEWITGWLMRVTGSDKSCFILGATEEDMLQFACDDTVALSVYTANRSAESADVNTSESNLYK